MVRLLAAAWRLRVRLRGDSIQPRTIVTRFAAHDAGVRGVPAVAVDRACDRVERHPSTVAAIEALPTA